MHELLDAGGHRELTGCVFAAAIELARDLERVEGVATRAFEDLDDGRPWQRATETDADHLVQCGDGQRGQLEVCPPLLRERRLERFRPPAVRPHRAEDADPRVDISPKREGERVRRCLVEPLRIVDRNEDWLGAGEFLQGRGGRRPECAPVDPPVDRIVPQERRRERPPLWCRQEVERGVVDVREQVDESRERERRLNARRPRDEHPPAPFGREVDARLPDGGLPDPRRAPNRERSSSV